MEKASPTYYRGIKFIRLSNLPQSQYEAIMAWLPPTCLIMIQTEESHLLDDCLQYRDYEYWFDNFYAQERADISQI